MEKHEIEVTLVAMLTSLPWMCFSKHLFFSWNFTIFKRMITQEVEFENRIRVFSMELGHGVTEALKDL